MLNHDDELPRASDVLRSGKHVLSSECVEIYLFDGVLLAVQDRVDGWPFVRLPFYDEIMPLVKGDGGMPRTIFLEQVNASNSW